MTTRALTLTGILAAAALALAQPAATVRGVVFDDRNANGARDAGEPGLAGVAVSNQADVVRTDGDGRYALDAARGHWLVSLSLPAGWQTASAPWRAIDPRADGVEDFALVPWRNGDAFTFLHVSDTHVNLANAPRLELVRRVLDARGPTFILVTGDLINDAAGAGEAESRRQFELYVDARGTFPVPVWSALGNHDVFGIERDASGASVSDPLYGKAMFRHVVNNTPSVIARLASVRWPLALGGHTHGRETLVFETTGQRTRFGQAASVVVPWETDPIPMVSGVTLYRVRGTDIDAGEFIKLGGP